MEELKPCPFCGSEGGFCVGYTAKGMRYISCGNCGCEGHVAIDRVAAIISWNKRS